MVCVCMHVCIIITLTDDRKLNQLFRVGPPSVWLVPHGSLSSRLCFRAAARYLGNRKKKRNIHTNCLVKQNVLL